MKRIILSVLSVLLLAGCSAPQGGAASKALNLGLAPSASPSVSQQVDRKCADKVAQSIATNLANGAFQCLSPDFQFQLEVHHGVFDDTGLTALFSGTSLYDVKNIPTPPGKAGRVFYYHFYPSDEKGTPGYYQDGFGWQVTVDSTGLVVDITKL